MSSLLCQIQATRAMSSSSLVKTQDGVSQWVVQQFGMLQTTTTTQNTALLMFMNTLQATIVVATATLTQVSVSLTTPLTVAKQAGQAQASQLAMSTT